MEDEELDAIYDFVKKNFALMASEAIRNILDEPEVCRLRSPYRCNRSNFIDIALASQSVPVRPVCWCHRQRCTARRCARSSTLWTPTNRNES